MEGWISLHRKLTKHWLWENKQKTKLEAWIDLLFLANHEDGIVEFREETIHVKRGQHITSELKLAARWKWSRGKIKRFLNRLQTDKMLDIKQDNRKTIITICNYSTYQNIKKKNGTTDSTTNGQQTGQQTDTNNNDNNDNNHDICQEVFNVWNKFAEQHNLNPVLKLSNKRKSHIKARFNEKEFDFVKILEKIQESSFLLGLDPKNDWKVDFDFVFASANNYLKILEGKYSGKRESTAEIFKLSESIAEDRRYS